MNKKIIFLLAIILFIVIFLLILSSFLNRSENKKNTQRNITSDQPTNQTQTTTKILENTTDFKVEYSIQNNKYVVTKKISGVDQKISDWLKQNNLSTTDNNVQIVDQSELAANPVSPENGEITPIVYPTIDPNITPLADKNAEMLVDILNSLLNGATVVTTPSPSTLSPSGLKITPANKKNGKYVYYSQCGGGFDNYPLPSGCTVCAAGCGPTTVAMIAASYVDKNITPKTVVDLYKQKGYFLGCAGSRTTDAKAALGSYGVKTTDFMTFSSATIDVAAKDFKNYLASGWTIFVLTYFCDAGCGHFFWLTEIGSNNTAWAYDPYYGRGQTPPINENTRYPFPKDRIAFGVKK